MSDLIGKELNLEGKPYKITNVCPTVLGWDLAVESMLPSWWFLPPNSSRSAHIAHGRRLSHKWIKVSGEFASYVLDPPSDRACNLQDSGFAESEYWEYPKGPWNKFSLKTSEIDWDIPPYRWVEAKEISEDIPPPDKFEVLYMAFKAYIDETVACYGESRMFDCGLTEAKEALVNAKKEMEG